MAQFSPKTYFTEYQSNIIDELLVYSHLLVESPGFAKDIAGNLLYLPEVLDNLRLDVEEIFFAVDMRLSFCFGVRLYRIQRELKRLVTLLETRPHLAGYISVILRMLALLMGGLELDGWCLEDGVAREVDGGMGEVKEQFVNGMLDEEAQHDIQGIWVRLSSSVDGCVCQQCVSA